MHFLEYGQIRKKARLRIALVYPNKYRAGSNSLAMHFIYNLANAHPDYGAERFFSDFTRSIESSSPLSDFDIVAFFLSFEEDYLNVFSLVRKYDLSRKLIIAGGICALNPYPLSHIIDVFFLGDAEESFPEFLDVCSTLDEPKKEKEAFSYIDGLFLPGIQEKARKRTSPLSFHPTRQPIQHGDYETSFAQSLMVEISRGCSRFCTFCLVSHCQGPRRERDVSEILRIVGEAQSMTRFSRVALVASDSHSRLAEIVRCVDFPVSLPSIKMEDIDAGLLSSSDIATLTIAPETGEEQRWRLHKRISDDVILEKVGVAKKYVRTLKAYLLFGLPGETEEDCADTMALARKMRKAMKTTFSVNAFVPKPHTPLEGHRFDLDEVKRKKRMFEKALHVRIESPYKSFLQWCLSVGDERVSAMLGERNARAWYAAFRDARFEKKYGNISLR